MDILGMSFQVGLSLDSPWKGVHEPPGSSPSTLNQCSHPPGEAPLIPKGGAWSRRGVHSSQGPTPFLQAWSPSHPGIRKIVGVQQRVASSLSREFRHQARQCSLPSPTCLPPLFTS